MCISSGHKSTTAIPTDINECETGDSMCPELASCSNTVGSYECNCSTGYSYDGQQNCTGKNPIPQEIQAIVCFRDFNSATESTAGNKATKCCYIYYIIAWLVAILIC